METYLIERVGKLESALKIIVEHQKMMGGGLAQWSTIRLIAENALKQGNEPATEDWIRNRWGGFDYLDLARNEDFSLYFVDGKLTLRYEPLNECGSDIVLFEKATQQNVIDAERTFGIEIE